MSTRTDTDAKSPSDAAETAAAPASEASSTPSKQQISLSLQEPAAETPAIKTATAAPASEAAKPAEMPKIFEVPKAIEIPKPVEAVMKVVEAMKPAEAAKAPAPPVRPAVVAPAKLIADESRSNRFAMLAASVAFAGALGAMAGALGTSVFARPGPAAATPLAATDFTAVQDSIASLRKEMSAIKSGVESSNRNANAQFAKFTERLERIDRAQAAPAAQLRQAIEAIDRLEKRVQAQGETTASARPQPAAVTTAAPPPAAEPPPPRVIEGWVVRHVSRGVAIIQGRRIGAIEVEAGDIVPGVGRIESIRRQDGRWVVLTSNGMITSPTPR
jgi:murein DD-endopeptidase MepM/ murein hydrolase activator NlpD